MSTKTTSTVVAYYETATPKPTKCIAIRDDGILYTRTKCRTGNTAWAFFGQIDLSNGVPLFIHHGDVLAYRVEPTPRIRLPISSLDSEQEG